MFVVTTVDSGYKALEFLGLRQGIESNDPTALSPSPQVRKSLLLSFENVSSILSLIMIASLLCNGRLFILFGVLTFDRKWK